MREASRAGLAGPGFAWYLNDDASLDELEFDACVQDIIDGWHLRLSHMIHKLAI